MKQLLKIKKDFILQDIPLPQCDSKEVLIKTTHSLYLRDVERSILFANKGNPFTKLLHDPEMLNFAIKKIKADGFQKTLSFGRAMMANWHTTGALILGEVEKVGTAIKDLSIGDTVVATGWYKANHAQYNAVTRSLVVPIPKSTDPLAALYSIYASKLMMLLDLLKIPSTSTIHCTGSEIGCAILESIVSEQKYALPKSGKVDFLFVLNTDITSNLLQQIRKHLHPQTHIIVISEKEIDTLLFAPYTAEQYCFFFDDRKLHLGNNDKRSLIDNLSEKHVHHFIATTKPELIHSLSTVSKDFAKTTSLYTSTTPAALIIYPHPDKLQTTIRYNSKEKPSGKVGVALLGVGNMARAVHLPILLDRNDIFIKYVFSKSGRSAASMAVHYAIPCATSSYEEILQDPEIGVIVILTHHSTHASYAIQAINANKHVFIEKPLCLTEQEGDDLIKAAGKSSSIVTVGFNKPFAPLAKQLKESLQNRKHPLLLTHRLQAPINFGKPWYYAEETGGGRLVGEYCHLFDFALYLTGSHIKSVHAAPLVSSDPYLLGDSNLVVTLTMEDGSIATLICSEDGNSKAPKERIEVVVDGKVFVLQDWQDLSINNTIRSSKINKGYMEHWDNFFRSIHGDTQPLVPLTRAFEAMKACFEASKQIPKR